MSAMRTAASETDRLRDNLRKGWLQLCKLAMPMNVLCIV